MSHTLSMIRGLDSYRTGYDDREKDERQASYRIAANLCGAIKALQTNHVFNHSKLPADDGKPNRRDCTL